MALEDFTTYTEVDPRGEITVTNDTVSWSNAYSVNYYVYKDFGTDFFSGDFEHKMTIWYNRGSNSWEPNFQWALSNNIGVFGSLQTDDFCAGLRNYGTNSSKFHFSIVGRSEIFISVSNNTVYYVTIKRDESIGTNGRLYVYLYSDSARQNLVNSAHLDITTKKKFRYYYPLMSEDSGTSYYQSGYTKDVDLGIKTDTSAFFQLF